MSGFTLASEVESGRPNLAKRTTAFRKSAVRAVRASGSMLASIVIVAMAINVLPVASAAASTYGTTLSGPVFHGGNVTTCDGLHSYISDPNLLTDTSWPTSPDNQSHSNADITGTVSGDSLKIVSGSNVVIDYVVVKGGNGGEGSGFNVYSGPAVNVNQSGLISPNGFSHWFVCYHSHTVGVPAISLTKSASPSTYSTVGNQITYTYVITNSGNVDLGSAQYTVTDDHIGSPLGTAFNCGSAQALAVGGTITCTAIYTITQADMNAGSVVNNAFATGGDLTSNTATATVITEQGPAITITKTASPTSILAGGSVTWSITVTNTGNVTLNNVSVSDAQASGCAQSYDGVLLPGGVWTFSCSTEGVVSTMTNTATAKGYPGESETPVTATASATVTVNSPPPPPPVFTPGISMTKTASPTTYNAVGQVITYTYVITNSGNESLGSAQYTVTDDRINAGAPFNCGSAQALAVGATVT
jgi:uncharacterized repeat protein (TIGR01451 family)